MNGSVATKILLGTVETRLASSMIVTGMVHAMELSMHCGMTAIGGMSHVMVK